MLRTGLFVFLLSAAAAPLAAQSPERWQVTLRSGQILYELQPESLSGDTLVLLQDHAARRLPLSEITELRRVRASIDLAERAGRNSIGALTGADDQVFQMTLLEVGEKRALVAQILRWLSADPGPG